MLLVPPHPCHFCVAGKISLVTFKGLCALYRGPVAHPPAVEVGQARLNDISDDRLTVRH